MTIEYEMNWQASVFAGIDRCLPSAGFVEVPLNLGPAIKDPSPGDDPSADDAPHDVSKRKHISNRYLGFPRAIVIFVTGHV